MGRVGNAVEPGYSQAAPDGCPHLLGGMQHTHGGQVVDAGDRRWWLDLISLYYPEVELRDPASRLHSYFSPRHVYQNWHP